MGRGESLPIPKLGWRTEPPPESEIASWLKALAPRNIGTSRRKLLAAHVVGWRWRLSAPAVLSKRLAQRRTCW